MITSIVLEWFDCSCQCSDDISRTRTTVYKSKNEVVYEEFNGRDEVLVKKSGKVPKNLCDRLFYILDEVNAEMTRETDYGVMVCDGSSWNMKIRHSNHTVQKVEGTVEYPPHGKRIEHELERICEEAGIFEPILFGCSDVRYVATKEFVDKWLKIFTEVPRNADFLFEEEMGNECFSLGFEMDCGHGFDEAYSKGSPLNRVDSLAAVIDEVDDVMLLGSAIFSQWRGITHWSYESGFTEDNKAWFLMALNKLKELI